MCIKTAIRTVENSFARLSMASRIRRKGVFSVSSIAFMEALMRKKRRRTASLAPVELLFTLIACCTTEELEQQPCQQDTVRGRLLEDIIALYRQKIAVDFGMWCAVV